LFLPIALILLLIVLKSNGGLVACVFNVYFWNISLAAEYC
jgi:hypothetical protein